jgi:hypothetical protein
MRLHLELHIDVPRTSHLPQVDVAQLLEHLAWGLRAEAEGLGTQIFLKGQAISLDRSTLRIVELTHAD